MRQHGREIAGILLDEGAVTVTPGKPFTWASGLRAPLYCDNRLLISNVEARRQVVAGFLALIRDQGWRPEVIGGTATAGIPHAAWLAEALSLPMIYIRARGKMHGKKNLIEGRLQARSRVVIIEDLISTGGSSIRAAHGVTEAGGIVVGIAAIFQYNLAGTREAFLKKDIPYATLTDLDALLDITRSRRMLSAEEMASVQQWREDPRGWSERQG